MYSKVNYTIVGVFVLLFSIGVIWFAFWLAKFGLQYEYNSYKVEMKESVAGLSIDSNVKLRGVNVGRVSEIRINPKDIEKVEIILKIEKDIPIKEDMVASTQMLGVTGLLSIEILGGTNAAKTLLPTEEYMPLIKSKPSLLSKLTNNLGGMSEKLDTLLNQSEKLFSEHNIETLGHIFDNAEKVSSKANVTLDEFKTSISNINEKFTQMQKDFAGIKKVSIPTIDKLMQTSENFNRVILKVEKSLDRGDYNLKKILEPMLVDIQILSTQLNTMTKELKENPSDLLFKSRGLRKGPGE